MGLIYRKAEFLADAGDAIVVKLIHQHLDKLW